MNLVTVILAAGQGSRAGGYKPLWGLGDETVIDRVIKAAASVSRDIRVVGGSNFDELKAHVEANHPQVVLIENTIWKDGMFSSVQAGVKGLELPTFIHPADIPGPGSRVYRELAEAFARNSTADVVRPTHAGRAGHPILLSVETVRKVQKAQPTSQLRYELKPLVRLDVPVDDELILRDFDTARDFESLKARLG
jgi:CTP:molybdopterin cytidylyltransferase MocA